jgi:hypothetical protein
MSVRRFYRLSMLIPLLVTAATLIGFTIFGQAIYGPLDAVQIVLGLVGLLGALPYSLLVLWAWHWMKNKSEREIRILRLGCSYTVSPARNNGWQRTLLRRPLASRPISSRAGLRVLVENALTHSSR